MSGSQAAERSTPQGIRSDEVNTSRISFNQSPSRPTRIVSPTKSPPQSVHGELSPVSEDGPAKQAKSLPPLSQDLSPFSEAVQIASEKEVLPTGSQSEDLGLQNFHPALLVAQLNAARRASIKRNKLASKGHEPSTESVDSGSSYSSNDSPIDGDNEVLMEAQQALSKKPSVIHHSSSFRRGVSGHSDSQLDLGRIPRWNDTKSSIQDDDDFSTGQLRHFSIDKGAENISAKALAVDLEKLARRQGGVPASVVENQGLSLDPNYSISATPRQRSIEEDQAAIDPLIKQIYGNNSARLSLLPPATPSPRIDPYDSPIPGTAATRDGLHPRFNSIAEPSPEPSPMISSIVSPRSFLLQPHPVSARLPPIIDLNRSTNKNTSQYLGSHLQDQAIPDHSMEIMVDTTQPSGNSLIRGPSLLCALRSNPPDDITVNAPRRSKTVPPRPRKTSFASDDLDTDKAKMWQGSVQPTPYPPDLANEDRPKVNSSNVPQRTPSKRDGGVWERFISRRGEKHSPKFKSTQEEEQERLRKDVGMGPVHLQKLVSQEARRASHASPTSPFHSRTASQVQTPTKGLEDVSTQAQHQSTTPSKRFLQATIPSSKARRRSVPISPTTRRFLQPLPPPPATPLPSSVRNAPFSSASEPYLMLLMRHVRIQTLRSMRVTLPSAPTSDDEAVALCILKSYNSLRGRWRAIFSARVLTSVRVLPNCQKVYPGVLGSRRGSGDSNSPASRLSIDEYMGLSTLQPTAFPWPASSALTAQSSFDTSSSELTLLLRNPRSGAGRTTILNWARHTGPTGPKTPGSISGGPMGISPIQEGSVTGKRRGSGGRNDKGMDEEMGIHSALADDSAPWGPGRIVEVRDGWAIGRIIGALGAVVALSILAGLLWIFLGAGGAVDVSVGPMGPGVSTSSLTSESVIPSSTDTSSSSSITTFPPVTLLAPSGSSPTMDLSPPAAPPAPPKMPVHTAVPVREFSAKQGGDIIGGTEVRVEIARAAPGGRVAGGISLAVWVLLAGLIIIAAWAGLSWIAG